MSAEQWASFLLDYKGPVDGDLTGYVKWVGGEITKLKGTAPTTGDPSKPFFPGRYRPQHAVAGNARGGDGTA